MATIGGLWAQETAGELRLGAIVGGVQKAGTTSLFRYLREHAQLSAPLRKELHWFDDEDVNWSAFDTRVLADFFPLRDRRRIAFEVTPIYLFWPPSLERIKAHNPDMRLVFIFRDPIERAWSHWRMETRRNVESLPFSAAIRQGRERLRGLDPLEWEWRFYSYVERGFYAQQLRRLFGLFPREQVLLLRSADLQADRRAVLARLAAFLQIDPFPDLTSHREHETQNEGARLSVEDVVYLRGLFAGDVREFSVLSGLPVDDWLTIRGT